MINTLIIEKLRGFNHFTLRDLGRINLLVGTNNSGKTTVLESIQMLSIPGDFYSIFRILFRRGEEMWESGERGRSVRHVDVRRLFRGHEIRSGSRFEVRSDSNDGGHTFAAEMIDTPPSAATSQPTLFEGDQDELPSPLAIRLTWDQNSAYDFLLPINRKGGLPIESIRRLAATVESSAKSRLITTASLSPEAVVELFESIVLTPEEDLVVEALKIIEPSIERIATSGSDRSRTTYSSEGSKGGVLVRCKDVNSRIPIGSMGDGIWRLLGLALALVRAENGILLVDEIDTGLHFTVMADMWRLIHKTAKRLNIQVFATSHSRDCFESLAVICREQVSAGSDITIQRIEKNADAAVGYTEQEIIAAAERGVEVR